MKELKITKRDGEEVEFDLNVFKNTISQLAMLDSNMLDNSKSTSAVGIHLNKIRPAGAGIYGTMKGNPLSWFDTMLGIDKPWVVAYKFPYDVINSNTKDNPKSLSWDDDRFDRRLDAEKYRLKKLIGYYTEVTPSPEKVSELEQELENIEEEHPEWII